MRHDPKINQFPAPSSDRNYNLINFTEVKNLLRSSMAFEKNQLSHHVLLNSVSKSGAHLLKNIYMMFVDEESIAGFFSSALMPHDISEKARSLKDVRVFKDSEKFSMMWSHLPCSPHVEEIFQNVKKILLVRDPYDWVLARRRWLCSKEVANNKSESLNFNGDIIKQLIYGTETVRPLRSFYEDIIAWLNPSVELLRYEDLIQHINNIDTEEAKNFFSNLLSWAGITELPDDWKQRIKLSSDKKYSPTHRSNLNICSFTVAMTENETLHDSYKKLIDFSNPNLRKILGYE